MNWGHSIILGFILFAAFVLTLVFRMVTSGNDLVKAKYYRTGTQINQELLMQEASADLSHRLTIQVLSGQPDVLEIRFDSVTEDVSGSAQFICLSDDKADQTIDLQPETAGIDKVQKVRLLKPKSGTWLCEINGKYNGKSILIKKEFTL